MFEIQSLKFGFEVAYARETQKKIDYFAPIVRRKRIRAI